MTPEEIQKLLGGYATGTLTGAEQQALFTAALEDQELFDTLAREQSLRDLLSDPAAKAQLLAALDARPSRWWWWRPAAVLAVAGLAAVAVIVLRPRAPQPPAAMVAQVRPPAPQQPEPAPPKTTNSIAPKAAQPTARKLAKPAAPDLLAATGRPASGPPPPAAAPPPPPAPKLEVTAESAPVAGGVIGGVAGGNVAGVPRANAPMSFRADAALPSARALFYGTPPALGVRYTIQQSGDTVTLRFTSNVNGYLSLAGAPPVALTAMEPYTTTTLAATGDAVNVVFSRDARTEMTTASALATEISGGENYVVSARPAPAIGFTITLKRQ
jgi:hypothetical protein